MSPPRLAAVCFSTGGGSRKARNLARDPRCSITPGDTGQALVVHGTARRLTDEAALARLREAYLDKSARGSPTRPRTRSSR